MANEFIIKNGFRSQGNSEITGSINVIGGAAIIQSNNDGYLRIGNNSGGFIVENYNRTDVTLQTNAKMTTRGTGITFRTTVGEPINYVPLAVIGSGATSGTTAFLVQNANASSSLAVLDNGYVGMGTSTPTERFVIDGDGVNITDQTNILLYSRATNLAGYSSILFKNPNCAATVAEIKATIGASYLNNTLGFFSQGSERMRIFGATGNITIGTTTDAGYRLDVSGTFRTLVSTETNPFVISHTNGNYATILIGNGSQLAAGQMGMYFNGSRMWGWNGAVFQLPGAVLGTGVNATTLQIFGGWGGATLGTSIRLGSNSSNQGVFTATTGTQSTIEIGNAGNETWSPSSGNATYNLLNLVPRFNTTGTYSGISRGLYYAPTLTSITGLTHRAIETVTGDVLFGTTSGNVGIGTTSPASRLSVSGSAGTGSAIYAYKSGSTVLDIQGSQGQLFSVIDALSGSLMSVNDVSGLPILEVFSDDRVVMGTYGAPALIVTGSNTVISGSLRGRVITLSTASATASMDCSLSNFFDLTLSGSMYLGVSNIQPGETINLRITQPATSGSLNYTSSIKFPNGLPYSASATSSVVDLISFISFDSSTLYATSLKNLI